MILLKRRRNGSLVRPSATWSNLQSKSLTTLWQRLTPFKGGALRRGLKPNQPNQTNGRRQKGEEKRAWERGRKGGVGERVRRGVAGRRVGVGGWVKRGRGSFGSKLVFLAEKWFWLKNGSFGGKLVLVLNWFCWFPLGSTMVNNWFAFWFLVRENEQGGVWWIDG